MRRNVQPKRVSGREAIRAIPQRARLLFPPSCGVTVSLLDALYEERGRFEDLRLFTGLIFVEHPVWQHLGGNIKLSTWHIAAAVQKSVDEGKADWFPIRMSQVASLFAQDGPLAVDAVLVQVSPPDEQGYVSLGAHVSTVIDAARTAPLVIAEVNRQAPRTLGNTKLHVSELDYLVEADYPVTRYRQATIGDLERKIAGFVAELIPDGATIQMGIGAIPEALMYCLDDKHDLGVHSGMASDGFMRLMERGVITGARKTMDRHKVVAGEAMGSAEFYRYVHNNPSFHFDSVNYSHNALAIAKLDNFVSINSAIEIDLAGQVNAETINARQTSGLGGQFDYVEAAMYSRGGRSIFAMPATAAKGKLSRIVKQLGAGAAVSTPRYCTDYVVTEFGTASLKGKTMRQRAEALTAIAHPDFRNELANSVR